MELTDRFDLPVSAATAAAVADYLAAIDPLCRPMWGPMPGSSARSPPILILRWPISPREAGKWVGCRFVTQRGALTRRGSLVGRCASPSPRCCINLEFMQNNR